MPNPSPTPIGQQIAALKRLHRLHEVNPKLLAKFVTQADRDYVMYGVAAAISTLEFVQANTAALRRGIEAARAEQMAKEDLEAARAQPARNEAGQ